jgi:hypothetical protein
MKTKCTRAAILFMLGFLSISSVKSQNYEMLVDSTKKWSSMASSQFPWWSYWSYAQRFANEVTIGNRTFREVLYSEDPDYAFWAPTGLVYEDTNSRVYAYDFESDTIRLIYDFGVRPDDTIKFYLFRGYYGMSNFFKIAEIESVDSVIFADKYRKQIHLMYLDEQNCRTEEIWIEGVGSLLGVMNAGTGDIVGSTNELLCYWENGELKYGSVCYDSNVGIEQKYNTKVNVTVCPNPVSSRSVLKIDSHQKLVFFSIEIFSASGVKVTSQKVKHKNHFVIEKEDFRKGFYTFKIITSNQEWIIGKFVVI